MSFTMRWHELLADEKKPDLLERRRKEIALDQSYSNDAFGTDGHLARSLIAEMSFILDALERSGIDINAVIANLS